jgi:transcriptional regulator with XRE-family HTH domain
LAKRATRQRQPEWGPAKAFGQALRDVRQQTGISQEQLGFDAGFDRTFISMIERGMQSPSIRTVVRLAEVLGVPPSEIVRRMETLLEQPRPSRSK